ncbi:MAG: Hsp33 family molecular chaperone HslO [Rhodocyclaceae bacterium]
MPETPSSTDFVRRFLFEDLDIRGAVVRLGPAWRKMQEGRGYAAAVARMLGEMTAVTLLIGANLKQPSRLTIQAQGHGPVSLLVIDITQELTFRGMARCGEVAESRSVPELLGDGRLTLTLQTDAGVQPYQSMVPLQGDTIGAVFEHYLAQSEQQPARLWLFASADAAVGLFLQKLPGADTRDADGWSRLEQLASTISAHELETLPVADLLLRVFPEETVRLFKPRAVRYECPKDWDKVRNMLRSLGREELDSVLAERGEVVVRDDICNHEYRFDAEAVARLFDSSASTVH